jgi:hypothetical protein
MKIEKGKEGLWGESYNTFLMLDICHGYNNYAGKKRFCWGMEKEKKVCAESYTTPFKVLLNFNVGLKI